MKSANIDRVKSLRKVMVEIPLFQTDEPLRFERIVLYPYPDMRRIWARAWLTAVQDQHPNVEIIVLNPDGTENNSVFMMAHAEPRLETTLHMRDPVPGATYHVVAELTLGLTDAPELLDRREFDMILEFRNPEKNEPGFGEGVDWEQLAQRAQDQ
jgi:hypothetical protein